MSCPLTSSCPLEANSPDNTSGAPVGELRWSALLDALAEPAAVLDADGRVAYVNTAWRAWAPPAGPGLPFVPRGEAFVEGCHALAADGHPSLATVAAAAERVLEGGDRSFEGHVAARAQDGSESTLTVRVDRIRDAGGALLVGLAWNPAHPVHTRRLREVERGYQALYEDSPIGLFSCRPDGRYLSANPAFLRMLGYASESDLRAAAPLLSGGSDSRPLIDLAGADRSASQAADREIELRRSDGTPVVLRIWLRPVLRDDGDLERIEGAAEDITDRRLLEGRLLEAQKLEAIGQLAGGVAHDFNNVLTVVLAEAQLALQAVEFGEDPSEHLVDIESAARGGSLVTRQLLMFARRDRNDPTSVEVGRAIMGVQRMIARLIGERIAVSLDLEPEALHVLVDPGRLDQALINLAVNARDAMPDGGSLTFRSRRLGGTDGRVEIVVTDTGHGMSAEVKERALEAFFTTKGRGEGTGLGLAAVKGMVQEAGGEVEIESREGSGTSVRLILPLHDRVAPASGTGASRPEGARNATILLVERADDVRTSTARLLTGAGMAVLQAGSGNEALEILARAAYPVDLLVADMGLADMSAPQLLQAARRSHPDLPAVLVTGHPHRVVEEESGRPPTVALRKPFSFEELAQAAVTALSFPTAVR